MYEDREIDDVISELLIESKKDERAIWDTLQEWVNWLYDNKARPGTAKTYFANLKNYLYHKGIKLDNQDIKHNLEFKKIPEDELYPLKLQDIKDIMLDLPFHKKVQYLAQLSSGMRIGEIVQIRKKHVDTSKKRIMIKLPPNITKLKRARTVILSSEAGRRLLPRIRKLDDNDLVWGSHENPLNSDINESQILNRHCDNAGLGMKYEENNRRKITTHSFRAYFITKMSRHDPDLAKFLAGQKGYLLQYDRLTDDEKLEEYLKYEKDLLIFEEPKEDTASLEQRIADLEKKFGDKFFVIKTDGNQTDRPTEIPPEESFVN